MKHYLDFLLRKRLLRVTENSSSNPGLFEITDKGKEFLKAYRSLKALMK